MKEIILSNGTANPASAILWDFGGVFTSSPFEAFNALEARLGVPADFIRQTNAINPESNAWAQFESNSVSLDQFDKLFAEESEARGYRIPGKDVIAMLSGTLRPRMIEVIILATNVVTKSSYWRSLLANHAPAIFTKGKL